MSDISQERIERTIQFHGHSCPGLALGIRASEVALREFPRSRDEEIVAVVETDNCAVDAIQYLTGCTFGKGNLIHLDYGKNAFTFRRRSDGKAIRLVARPEVFQETDEDALALRRKMGHEDLTSEERQRLERTVSERTKRIMDAPLDDLFEREAVHSPMPRKARILESLVCDACGEATMESRTRRLLGQTLCIPCFEALEKRQ
jgi:formylmethanofuran dehydrogenase subunit E